MTPLEAARKMAENAPMVAAGKLDIQEVCAMCWATGGHDDDCPWLAMPQIVKALGVAQAVVDSTYYDGDCKDYHTDQDAVDMLARALKGDQPA